MSFNNPSSGFCNFLFLFILASLPLNTNSLSFNFSSFDGSNPVVVLQGNASISQSQIDLTVNQIDTAVTASMGRALYPTPIQLWKQDGSTKNLTDFTTQFTFSISEASSTSFGDGLTFCLLPLNIGLLGAAYGGRLGLYNISDTDFTFANTTSIVAVEFDTYKNPWDPSDDHIGIDINSVKSKAYVNVSVGLKNQTGQAFISYHSTTKNLSVSLTIEQSSTPYTVSLSYLIDLSTILPQTVQVGFSDSTGSNVELHKILDWSFNSTLEATTVSPTPVPASTPTVTGSTSKAGLVAGIAVGLSLVLIIGLFIVWRIRSRRKRRGQEVQESDIEATQFDIDDDFDEEAGPKMFAYSELSRATNNFSMEGKLGEGGFGGVYKGVLAGPGGKEIAVKKIKSGSSQGKKEYVSEVKTISRLRHRNLVQLLGWCHDRGELLLVYEFMPNGSLDFHLFNPNLDFLPWATRYKIALGLSSALLYLHKEWEQSVVHRDIKCSNVMLDLNFNPKLGDFGLARLTDHVPILGSLFVDSGLQTTVVAGTPGYLAPECLLTGKASRESDVYSFGIAALEIACGRKVIEVKEEASKVNLPGWVWDLYGKGLILEVVDNRLEGKFDERQAECLMIVGLWCSHSDASCRPTIKQAITTLNFETALPSLPPQLPVPVYVSPGMNMSLYSSYVPTNTSEGSHDYTSGSSVNTSSITNSSLQSIFHTYPLLGVKNDDMTNILFSNSIVS